MFVINPVWKQLFQTGFIPIICDIQSFAQAKTATDYLFALLGVVPGIGEAIQAYKVAKAAKNLQGMKKALDKAATVATAQGYVSKTKIKVGQTEFKGYCSNWQTIAENH